MENLTTVKETTRLVECVVAVTAAALRYAGKQRQYDPGLTQDFVQSFDFRSCVFFRTMGKSHMRVSIDQTVVLVG